MKKDKRREGIRKFVNCSPFSLTAADISKIFGVSKPTAGNDLDYLLKEGLVDRNKVRRNWNIREMARDVKVQSI